MTRRGRPIVLAWLRAVVESAAGDEDGPSSTAIVAVATVRVLFANPDGTRSYPSRLTIARQTGVRRQTVAAVDAWLLDRGLMRFVRHRPRGVKEFALVLPVVPVEDQLPPVPDVPPEDQLGDAPAGADVRQMFDRCASRGPQPPTSERSEEEDGRSASADAPAGAPSDDALRCARSIADRSGVTLDLAGVAHAVDRLLARSKWAPEVVAHLGAEKASKAKKNPTAYLVTGLDALDPAAVALPVRLRVLNALARLLDLEDAHDALHPDECHLWSAERGICGLESQFVPAGIDAELADYVDELTPGECADLESRLERHASTVEARVLELRRRDAGF